MADVQRPSKVRQDWAEAEVLRLKEAIYAAESVGTVEEVRQILSDALKARNLDGTNHWTPHDDPRGIGR